MVCINVGGGGRGLVINYLVIIVINIIILYIVYYTMSYSTTHRITMAACAALATVFRLQVLIIIQYLYLSNAGSTTNFPPNVCGNLFK